MTALSADPGLNPFNWPHPALGTTLNGPRLTQTMALGVEALRVALAGAGFQMSAEEFTPAKLASGSTTQAFRTALCQVADMSAPEVPLFKVGVRTVATYVPDETSPDFRMRALALGPDDVALWMGDPSTSRADMANWAEASCAKLVSLLTP